MKYNRQARILDIIDKYPIETQDELVEKLRDNGMDVTQATISRDIRELRLTKVSTEEGKHRYSAITQSDISISERLMTIFSESYVSADYAANIVIVKTLPGMAQAAAFALDSLKWPEIVGTIAGDDTIMIVCRAEVIAEKLVEKFSKISRDEKTYQQNSDGG